MAQKKIQVWLPLLFSVVMIAGMYIGFKLKENTAGGVYFLKNARKTSLQEILDLVNSKYVDNISNDSLNMHAIDAMLSHLDPHTIYIPPVELQSVNEDLQGNFEGIGVEFQLFNDTVNIVNVIENGPSFKAGVQTGDKLIKVNDTNNIAGKNISTDEIRKLLRGPQNSTVTITVIRNGKLQNILIHRGVIPLPSVDAAYMILPQTGFIRLSKFAETTYPEFMDAITALQKKGMQKLILDLRGNGGGFINEATDIADEFLDDNKLIVYTRGAHAAPTDIRCKRPGVFEKGKLVVLIDETSASASEILSGALQDWDRATLIGRRTFGKGLVQQQFSLSDGGALRLTVARYYTPLGRNIQKPYDKGKEIYDDELIERFHDGEVMHGDTAKPKGEAYKTPAGHIVYGGGGITPDIFVPFDTTTQSQEVLQLYAKNTLNNFIYNYYIEHKNFFSAFTSIQDFIQHYMPADQEWQSLSAFALKDGINLNKLPPAAKNFLQHKMQALMARQIWRSEGYFEVSNASDAMIEKAEQVLAN